MRLLIVEDEPAMAAGLKFNFESEGYEVAVAEDGFRALELFEETLPLPEGAHAPAEPFAVIILDLMLPGMSGYEICRRIRVWDPHVPVLVLSARTLSEDRTLAFDAGTDQYLMKPFELAELLARVRNLIERQRVKAATEPPTKPSRADSSERQSYVFGNVELDLKRYELNVGQRTYSLTSRELELLRYFIEHEGQVLSRSQILKDVWDEPAELSTRTIDNFVLRLRKYIEPNPTEPEHILSVRGAGYRFVAEPQNTPPPA